MFLEFNESYVDDDILSLNEEEELEVDDTEEEELDDKAKEISEDTGLSIANEVMDIYYTFSESYYESAIVCAIAESKSLISEDVNAYNEAEETFFGKIRSFIGCVVDGLKKKFSEWYKIITDKIKKVIAYINDKLVMAKIKMFGGQYNQLQGKDGKKVNIAMGQKNTAEKFEEFIMSKMSADALVDYERLIKDIKNAIENGASTDDVMEAFNRKQEMMVRVLKDQEISSKPIVINKIFVKRAWDFLASQVKPLTDKVKAMFKTVVDYIESLAKPKPDAEGKVGFVKKGISCFVRVIRAILRFPIMLISKAIGLVRGAVKIKKKEDTEENK